MTTPGRPYTYASGITKTRVRWTWKGRLALGYLAVWCGAGDLGKSLFACWVIRGLTVGELDGEFHGTPRDALIVCTEDGRDDMWLPRLEAAGADLQRVAFLDYPRGWNLRDGISFIDDAVEHGGSPLIYIDALMAHMPDAQGGENTRSPTFVRNALQPLADLCKERKVTALFGLHPRKAGGDTFADVVQESGAFTQLPRLGLLFGYHPDDLELPRDQQRRVVLRGKGNVGRDPGALSFTIAGKHLDYGDDDPNEIADDIGYITDVQACHITERQLLHPKPEPGDRPLPKHERARELIEAWLHDGEWHPAAPIRERLAALELDHDTVVGKATTRVEKRQHAFQGPWHWRIVNSSNSTPKSDSVAPRATLDPPAILWTTNETNSLQTDSEYTESLETDEEPTSTPQNHPANPQRARERTTFTCCCADNGLDPNPHGRCTRCNGYVLKNTP
jgi:hypothetical protein